MLLDLRSSSGRQPELVEHPQLGAHRLEDRLGGAGDRQHQTHEIGHYGGLLHTDNTNGQLNMIDSGGNALCFSLGLGPDATFGTADDIDVLNVVDDYDPTQGNGGSEDTNDAISWGFTSAGVTAAGANVVNVFDVSRSMTLVGGLDVSGPAGTRDGVVDDFDDLNGSDGEGTLLDFELADALPTESSSNVIFGRDASILVANAQGLLTSDTSVSTANDGVSDHERIVRSIKVGEGGYFRQNLVDASATNYELALGAILKVAVPGTTVNMYSDGSGRLPANSAALANLVAANIRVNVIVVGGYQTVAPVTDFTGIAAATGGSIRSVAAIGGTPPDGGFPSTIVGGGARRETPILNGIALTDVPTGGTPAPAGSAATPAAPAAGGTSLAEGEPNPTDDSAAATNPATTATASTTTTVASTSVAMGADAAIGAPISADANLLARI